MGCRIKCIVPGVIIQYAYMSTKPSIVLIYASFTNPEVKEKC